MRVSVTLIASLITIYWWRGEPPKRRLGEDTW